ncbi:alpha/beta fold hydrolase [Williamsia deligens]|uniref:Alpha/beta fold hydrolase n=1 Tax=Williamsia deligens TaxID=321325 RepID=A0ABW3GGP0_9NOCA|nr:alpha/beta hydrolase [Williamsia deligens]MCP2195514.1 Pimeloyl-ACP methyl ester carboxylesterase [Williamsia deligens]
MDVQTQTVTVGDLDFTVRTGGPPTGPAVLLLHGFPNVGTCYDGVVARLHESGLRTIVPDQRGYSPGAQPTEVQAYGIAHLVDDAIGILDAVGVHYALAVGHDWGALVAWHLAGRHPERLTGLVAASVGHPSAIAGSLSHDDDQRRRSSYIPGFIDPSAEDTLLADDGARLCALVPDDSVLPLLHRPTLTGALNWYRANFTGDIAGNLACPPVEVPTTMVWSDGDPALGRAQAEASGRFVYSDYRFSELHGVDHWVPQNAAASLASEIALRSSTW